MLAGMDTLVGGHTGPRLDPRIPVLTRPSGALQLGWDPDTALLLRPPAGVAADTLAGILRLLDGLHREDEVVWQANRAGIDGVDIAQILAELDAAGALVPPRREPAVRSVHLHGRGPLADGLAAALGDGRVRVARSVPDRSGACPLSHGADCVVLTDELVPDPRTVAGLVAAGVAHLQVRFRDGRGVVGPLVLPGRTSCLRCADLTRTGRDPEWPHLAAQLLGRVGHARPDTVLATTALAATELSALIDADPARPPASLNATLELDLAATRLVRRPWRPHPRCGCRGVARDRVTRDVGEPADRPP
ncbi:hypothetical protein GCM10023094_25880 [Rhodococcus olei]|uniref:Bacteriocin biosynthesis cyclodehydratase domain-containing protein n=2 Tax=Rhodococcus olei TaxID=2161675 RepID=A0ABP8P470_9NOCA